MNVYALQTARAGSKSVPNKNIANVKGIPLFLHNILHAKKSKYLKDIFVSTDIDLVKKHSQTYNYQVIDRPPDLAGDNASHYDTILHGLKEIEKKANEKVDILVVLLGNSIGAFTHDLDKSIEILMMDSQADSIQSVSEYNMYNPFRAFQNDKGYLTTVVPQSYIRQNAKTNNINDRNSAGNIYFFNGSFWVIKRESLIKNEGLLPFPWLGNKIVPFLQKNYMEVDAMWQLSYLEQMDWSGFSI